VTNWVTFTRRTEDPKLAYIERRLTELGIEHRRAGSSRHAPILQVPEDKINEAWALLDEEVTRGDGTVTRLDDIADDDPMFSESMLALLDSTLPPLKPHPNDTQPSTPSDHLEPDWQAGGHVHNWRNHVSNEIRHIWPTFTPAQRAALARDAEGRAGDEEWE
jgi:hypothetical protein